MKPLVRINRVVVKEDTNLVKKFQQENPSEVWHNDEWIVNKRAGIEWGNMKDENGESVKYTWLSIKRKDNQAKPDWRVFQWIKNQLVGEECEGIEVYPPESRLIDTCNQFHLWVFEKPEMTLGIGGRLGNVRMVTEKMKGSPTQRKFPHNRKPKDLEKNQKELQRQLDEFVK